MALEVRCPKSTLDFNGLISIAIGKLIEPRVEEIRVDLEDKTRIVTTQVKQQLPCNMQNLFKRKYKLTQPTTQNLMSSHS